VVILVGAPGLGSDFGGVLTVVPALLMVAMIGTGIRVSIGRVAAAVIVACVLVAVIAILDHSRPADDQTHMGRFVEQILDGTAWEVLERKAAAMRASFGREIALLLPALLVALYVLFRRPGGAGRELISAAGRSGLAAAVGVAIVAVVGTLVNDSGIAVFVAAAGTFVPLLLGAALAPPPTGPPVDDPPPT
jgi:hypothetical protein